MGVYNCGANISYIATIDSNHIVITKNVIDTSMLTCLCYFKVTMNIDSFCYQNFTVMYQGNYILETNDKQYDLENLIIAPNPSKDYVKVNFIDTFNKNEIEIYDMYGKLQKCITIKDKNELVDISELKQGIYLVKAVNSNMTYKLIKE